MKLLTSLLILIFLHSLNTEVLSQNVVINEINYNSALDFNSEDWVEFYNPNEYAVNFAGWQFRDEEDIHEFVFPAGTVLPPNGYLVLCADTVAFHSIFPEVTNYLGNFLFGLSGGGELLRLYDFSGLLIDTVHYDDVAPWPPDADGLGPTLELIDPLSDNALPENWTASGQHGTPGWENGLYTSVSPPADLHPIHVSVVRNPFRDQVSFMISTGQDFPIELMICDLVGKPIWEQTRSGNMDGKTIISWNGLTQNGQATGPGIYFCRISSGSERITLKLIKAE